ncbi:hypoxanthine phosphoribosyltransferase [Nitritalea halalkaliphila]|nr:hypoxanthine phosphoribosyltransferase [Nitritalea halalkaliphila]
MIQILDKSFVPYLSKETLQERIQSLGAEISADYAGKPLCVLAVLNGAFMFCSDLVKEITIPMELQFIKIASYAGTRSTGEVSELLGLSTSLKGKEILIVEDIVDTGLSMQYLLASMAKEAAASIRICSLLVKPEALQHPVDIHYTGFEIPKKFVVGYGLDYNGFGRNIGEIYQLKEDEHTL